MDLKMMRDIQSMVKEPSKVHQLIWGSNPELTSCARVPCKSSEKSLLSMIQPTRQVMSMSKRTWTYQAKGKDCGKLKKPSSYLMLLPGRIMGLRLTNIALFFQRIWKWKVFHEIAYFVIIFISIEKWSSTMNTHMPFT